LFLADTTINFNPTAEELAEITLLTAKEVKQFNIVPRIAMLSYSNFGSSNSDEANLVRKAREIVKAKDPTLVCDGEVQGILAFNKEIVTAFKAIAFLSITFPLTVAFWAWANMPFNVTVKIKISCFIFFIF